MCAPISELPPDISTMIHPLHFFLCKVDLFKFYGATAYTCIISCEIRKCLKLSIYCSHHTSRQSKDKMCHNPEKCVRYCDLTPVLWIRSHIFFRSRSRPTLRQFWIQKNCQPCSTFNLARRLTMRFFCRWITIFSVPVGWFQTRPSRTKWQWRKCVKCSKRKVPSKS